MEAQGTRRCSRCGGTGSVTRGSVINGVCYGCGGVGVVPIRPRASWKSRRVVQYAAVDSCGAHLAINTDRDMLESLRSSIPGIVDILEMK
jgi:hypothetical protein